MKSPSCEPVVVLHPATAQLRQRWGASLANGSTNCIGKAAGKGSESGTGVIAPVKLETENMLKVDGGRIARTVSWFVSPTFSPLHLDSLEVVKPAHRQRILMSLLQRWVIYPMA